MLRMLGILMLIYFSLRKRMILNIKLIAHIALFCPSKTLQLANPSNAGKLESISIKRDLIKQQDPAKQAD